MGSGEGQRGGREMKEKTRRSKKRCEFNTAETQRECSGRRRDED